MPHEPYSFGPIPPTSVIVRTGNAMWTRWATPWVALAFVVWPLYVFPPGFPQPVTFALVLALCIAAVEDIRGLIATAFDRRIVLIGLFVLYAAIVNSVVAISSQDIAPLIHSLYYVQVAIGCVVVQYVLRTEARAQQIVYWSIWTALIVQAVALVVMDAGEGRATLFFGNPNQLSLFGLLALAYLLLLNPASRTSAIFTLVGVAVALLLILVSLSKAAMVSAFVMLALAAMFLPVTSRLVARFRPLAFVLIPIAVACVIVYFRDEFTLLNSVLERLGDIGVSADDSLTGRGYSRILDWPQYLLLGAGEGLHARFGVHFEIHSMFGTLLFSYGLTGLVIVLSLFAVTARHSLRLFAVLFFPILLYSLTHHPMRQPMLWSLLLFIGAGPRIDRQLRGQVR